ncbi:MAG: ATP-binding cassette domain-containing protein [Luteitalea sp.]|nr:ATP-binding cassette domain-containing protein [Luteitalea sp.]
MCIDAPRTRSSEGPDRAILGRHGLMTTVPASFFKHRGVRVEVKDLSKRYRIGPEEVHALRDTDWAIETGTAAAIMGPSGCGKTTLLNLLGGVDRPSSGQIKIDNDDLTSMSERMLEKHRLVNVGFVFQFFNLIPSITAIENLELPMVMAGVSDTECRERAQTLLSLVGLAAKGEKRPEELSGGEQQRVAVALALANDPALILADEPTGNLDSTNAAAISTLLRGLAEDYGKTVILVSHDPKTVEHFPKVYSMRDGQFVAAA